MPSVTKKPHKPALPCTRAQPSKSHSPVFPKTDNNVHISIIATSPPSTPLNPPKPKPLTGATPNPCYYCKFPPHTQARSTSTHTNPSSNFSTLHPLFIAYSSPPSRSTIPRFTTLTYAPTKHTQLPSPTP
ncbi:hypothetical protein K458DRAFT_89667 [Lentithecium fluviatile CBS 122367]|uniref:Uncharacterized protein n=1 Tax=Lentithecium fluviatile CBS 122367 TaxID=1168545 RepID=A0A6G1ISL4_9PLEO|nr:hypothetical protein K458DRAFT_89667 [Lentithecium fluviatile CBS 122367]